MAKQYIGRIDLSIRICIETNKTLSEQTIIDNVFPLGLEGEVSDTKYDKLEFSIVCDRCGKTLSENQILKDEDYDLCADCYKQINS